MRLEQKIEALLFYKAEPMKIKELSKLLQSSEEKIKESVEILGKNLENRGINLVISGDKLELRTASEEANLIENIRREELSRDLGKAGSEVLAIILYKGHVTRSEIDYIRGVNSTFILRNLLIRGLIEKTSNPNDSRSYIYKTTTELLSFLGVTSVTDLPEYQKILSELKKFESESLDTDSMTIS